LRWDAQVAERTKHSTAHLRETNFAVLSRQPSQPFHPIYVLSDANSAGWPQHHTQTADFRDWFVAAGYEACTHKGVEEIGPADDTGRHSVIFTPHPRCTKGGTAGNLARLLIASNSRQDFDRASKHFGMATSADVTALKRLLYLSVFFFALIAVASALLFFWPGILKN
jgi:hypothetical protein